MREINFLKQKGIASNFTIVGVLLLAVSLPIAVLLVQKNQENRSNAAGETTNEMVDDGGDIANVSVTCGSADGKDYASRPTNDLCGTGNVLWKDSSGNDGSYLWSCIDDSNVDNINSVDCSAVKISKEEGGSIDGRCGDANGMDQNSKPISNYVLCKAGELAWTDEVADDGDFNWSCNGINDGQSVDCVAFKVSE